MGGTGPTPVPPTSTTRTQDRLSRIELHEMREFLKFDGKCVDDPHAEGANDEFLPWDGTEG